MNYVVQLSIYAGVLLLVLSLKPTYLIVQELPKGSVRIKWFYLISLIFIFIVGYVLYSVSQFFVTFNIVQLYVSSIFLLGAVFVLAGCQLMLHTLRDINCLFALKSDDDLDPVLGIHNRISLDKHLIKEFEQYRRFKGDLSVLVIDFYSVQELSTTFGMRVVEVVLGKIANLLNVLTRDSDFVAHIGGEKLVVLLPKTPREGAETFAHRLVRSVSKTVKILADDNNGIPVDNISICVGVAVASELLHDADELLENADQALYKAREKGENQVVVHTESGL